jgi:tetratricopeptide (TPR) repeat protein
LLDHGNTADFVQSVAEVYTLATLERLLREGDRMARRGAVMAITLMGRRDSIRPVGEALRDPDRGVRLIAEDGLQAMWFRAGTFEQNQQLQMVVRLNAAAQFGEALQRAERILDEHAAFGEVWFQHGESLWGEGDYIEAIADYQRALACEPHHFPAALSKAQCYLELGDLPGAIQSLEQTLDIHPHLEVARAQIVRLERELREQTDR